MKKLLFVVLALMATSVFANPYVRLSGGSSTWDSPYANLHSRDNQSLFDDRDNAVALAVGKHVTDDLRIELEYTDFGDANLSFNDSYTKCIFHWCKDFSDDYMTDFEAYGVTGWVVYDVYSFNIAENYPLSFHVRGGFSRGTMKGTVNGETIKDSDGGIAYGGGLDLKVWKELSINASWEQHSFVFDNDFDYEPKVAKLGVTWQF